MRSERRYLQQSCQCHNVVRHLGMRDFLLDFCDTTWPSFNNSDGLDGRMSCVHAKPTVTRAIGIPRKSRVHLCGNPGLQPGTGDETPPIGTGSIPYGPYPYLRRTGPNGRAVMARHFQMPSCESVTRAFVGSMFKGPVRCRQGKEGRRWIC